MPETDLTHDHAGLTDAELVRRYFGRFDRIAADPAGPIGPAAGCHSCVTPGPQRTGKRLPPVTPEACFQHDGRALRFAGAGTSLCRLVVRQSSVPLVAVSGADPVDRLFPLSPAFPFPIERSGHPHA